LAENNTLQLAKAATGHAATTVAATTKAQVTSIRSCHILCLLLL
jgi:hypothetical protein